MLSVVKLICDNLQYRHENVEASANSRAVYRNIFYVPLGALYNAKACYDISWFEIYNGFINLLPNQPYQTLLLKLF